MQKYLTIDPRANDLTGHCFGKWTALGLVAKKPCLYWLCRCDCGREKAVRAISLTEGLSQSCGCVRDGIKSRKFRGLCECGEHAFAALTRGYVGIVDAADAAVLSGSSWCAHRSVRGAWAVVASGNRKLHHEILGKPPSGLVVDHINGNPFDNQRGNMRVCPQAGNTMNRRAKRIRTSIYKGIAYYARDGLWVAQIAIGGATQYLGRFTDEAEAARAYDAAAIKLHGEFARTNVALGLLPPIEKS